MLADMTTGETSVVVIITGLILNFLTGLWTAWLSYKSKQSSDKSTAASKVNTGLIVDNTLKTVETQKSVNGILEERVRAARAEGVLAGLEQAKALKL